MVRGRKPKPSELKILEGTDRTGRDEPKPTSKRPPCPAHLDKRAKAEWRRIAGELDELGLLSAIDRAALAAYCSAWSQWVEATEELKTQDKILTNEDKGTKYRNPWLDVASAAVKTMHQFLTEFGMTPASRTRVAGGKGKKKKSGVKTRRRA